MGRVDGGVFAIVINFPPIRLFEDEVPSADCEYLVDAHNLIGGTFE